MEEKKEKETVEKVSSMDEIIQALISLKGRPFPTDDRLFVGDIPKSMINRFDWLEADGEE